MKNIRNNIFETNSSSIHSITIDSGGLEPSVFKLDKDGKIHTKFKTFGKDYNTYNAQEDKLSYLVSLCFYLYGPPMSWHKRLDGRYIYNGYAFKCIESAVCDYSGASGIIIDNLEVTPLFDHQTIPVSSADCIINMYDEKAVTDFIFNKYISLVTDTD